MEPIDLSCYLKQCPPSREEVEEMCAAYIADHERRFMAQGVQVGMVVGSVTGAIVLWIFGAIYWLGQRLN